MNASETLFTNMWLGIIKIATPQLFWLPNVSFGDLLRAQTKLNLSARIWFEGIFISSNAFSVASIIGSGPQMKNW